MQYGPAISRRRGYEPDLTISHMASISNSSGVSNSPQKSPWRLKVGMPRRLSSSAWIAAGGPSRRSKLKNPVIYARQPEFSSSAAIYSASEAADFRTFMPSSQAAVIAPGVSDAGFASFRKTAFPMRRTPRSRHSASAHGCRNGVQQQYALTRPSSGGGRF